MRLASKIIHPSESMFRERLQALNWNKRGAPYLVKANSIDYQAHVEASQRQPEGRFRQPEILNGN